MWLAHAGFLFLFFFIVYNWWTSICKTVFALLFLKKRLWCRYFVWLVNKMYLNSDCWLMPTEYIVIFCTLMNWVGNQLPSMECYWCGVAAAEQNKFDVPIKSCFNGACSWAICCEWCVSACPDPEMNGPRDSLLYVVEERLASCCTAATTRKLGGKLLASRDYYKTITHRLEPQLNRRWWEKITVYVQDVQSALAVPGGSVQYAIMLIILKSLIWFLSSPSCDVKSSITSWN